MLRSGFFAGIDILAFDAVKKRGFKAAK